MGTTTILVLGVLLVGETRECRGRREITRETREKKNAGGNAPTVLREGGCPDMATGQHRKRGSFLSAPRNLRRQLDDWVTRRERERE